MMRFKYYNPDSGCVLWQWDTEQWLDIENGTLDDSQYVHFVASSAGTKTDILSVHPAGNRVQIPNQLLKQYGSFYVYAYTVNENGDKTLFRNAFYIKPRPIPPEYIDDPTPVITYPELLDLINELRALDTALQNISANAETISAGSDAYVTVTKTEDGYIYTFGIPRGKQGIKGDTGPKGDKGESGPKGDPGEDAVIDPTLSHEGEAADAGAVGTELENVKRVINLVNAGLADKMNKSNPTGTGKLSLNRLAGSTEGAKSVAVNNDTTASAANAFAEGYKSVASGENAHAEGQTTTASGNSAHAEGKSSEASGLYSHAENNSTASGSYSHAEGYRTQATASGSHAEGSQTEATHEGSHAEGLRTKTGRSYQHVAGKDNVVKADCARVTGWGTASEPKNIEELDINGNLKLAGDVFAQGRKLAVDGEKANLHGGNEFSGYQAFNDEVSFGSPVTAHDGLSMDLTRITELDSPSNDYDAANKKYVDEAVGGFYAEIEALSAEDSRLEELIGNVIPQRTVALGIINGIMTTIVSKIMTVGGSNAATSIDSSSDNTLHTTLEQAYTDYGNVLTKIKVGDTQRTMLFKRDNANANGGIYSSDGFYVDEAMGFYWTYRLIVEWNRISAFVTKYSYFTE